MAPIMMWGVGSLPTIHYGILFSGRDGDQIGDYDRSADHEAGHRLHRHHQGIIHHAPRQELLHPGPCQLKLKELLRDNILYC